MPGVRITYAKTELLRICRPPKFIGSDCIRSYVLLANGKMGRGRLVFRGGVVQAGGLCRRWLELFGGYWRDAGQAPSLDLARALLNWGNRADTRPAPTGRFGGGAANVQAACEGRHKACPYWIGWGGLNTGRCRNRSGCPGRSGMRWGALRGESPRTREGRRPDRTELQWSVVSYCGS